MRAQTTQNPAQEPGDVVRIFTNLVQTDVMVFDKQGHAVNGLTREQFALKIDGKAIPIEFFELVSAGSDEEAQLAAARGGASTEPTVSRKGPVPLDRGRLVFFYVDDLHLDLSGLAATKKLVTSFLENEMGQNDEVAVSSASGQIGFLQQLTDNKAVLKAALERLSPRPYIVRDHESPEMREYHAILINAEDFDTVNYFVDETLRLNPGMMRDMALNVVKNRANVLLQQASHVTINTLSGLESLISRARKLAARKLVFFISDGFFLDSRNSDSRERLQRISSAAARSGAVVYSMDARGLIGSLEDASSTGNFDPSGRLQRATQGELTASQDGMFALAHDTGGRAIFNTNDLKPGLKGALKETSFYYLLAWKPDRAPAAGRFHRIEVKIPSKPELVVRVRRGFFDIEPSPAVAKKLDPKAPETKPLEKELHDAIVAPYSERQLPISLTLTHLHTPEKGSRLSASMEVPAEFLKFSEANGKPKAMIDLAGSFFNDRGQVGNSFSAHVDIDAKTEELANGYKRDLGYTYPVFVGPGLYQVRVAARDGYGGAIGSANAWIQIPDISSHQLTLSSLLLGQRSNSTAAPASTNNPSGGETIGLSVSHRFRNNSYLRFLVFVYNSVKAPTSGNPNVAIQVLVVRDKQPVITTPLRAIETDGVADLDRLPYAAEIPLMNLPSGSYRLQVNVIDRVSKLSATQDTRFEIY